MLWFVYNILFAVGYTLMLPYFLFRMARRGGYAKDFKQRFAMFTSCEIARIRERPRIWVHAVSVGEVLVALRFMEEYRALEPGAGFVLTTTTSTGYSLAGKRLHPSDVLAYFPVDFTFVVRKELDILNPVAMVLVECELWPNVIRVAAARGVPVFLVNGRISEGSLRGYRLVKVFFASGIRKLSLICVQTAEDGRRLVELGTDPGVVRVMGSVKYDVAGVGGDGAGRAESVLRAAGVGRDDMLIVGGSTWPGEEAVLAGIFKRLRATVPGLRLAIIPRHVERTAEVEAELGRLGLKTLRRSAVGSPGAPEDADLLLVDTTGELAGFYACASVVFVGKSLTNHGGQNIIEPALHGKAVVVGPNMQNFAGVMRDFLDARAIVQVPDAAGLEAAMRSLVLDSAARNDYGRRAAELVRSKKGALRATVELVRSAIAAVGKKA